MIFAIAVLNICLGFAVALLLGHRWRALVAADAGGLAPCAGSPAPHIATAPAAPPAAAPKPDAAPPPPKVENRPAASPQAQAVTQCRAHVDTYQQRLDVADQQLRGEGGGFDAAGIEACLEALRTATAEYLSERRSDEAQMGDLETALGRGSDAAAVLRAAVTRQDAQIGTAQERFAAFKSDGDIAQEREELVVETSRLLDANHGVRDALTSATVAFDFAEHRLEADDVCPRDGLTELATRAGLEVALAKLWQRDPHRMRSLCVAMIDIDAMAAINQAHGHRAGDGVLTAVGGILKNDQRQEMIVGRFTGQRFCVLLPDCDSRFASNLAERIRQTLELTHFVHNQNHIRLTVSCGITQSTPEDTPGSLFERVQAALFEAKRYGRNRAFLHDGKYPTPVIPPNFSLEEKEIDI